MLNRAKVIIDHTKIPDDLVNFPHQVVLNRDVLPDAFVYNSISFKSFIMDGLTNHGDLSYMGFRAIHFYKEGVRVNVTSRNCTCYATNIHSSVNEPVVIFDVETSPIGDDDNNEWLASISNITNQRIICVFDEIMTCDQILYHNFHDGGTNEDAGIKDVNIYISDDSITDTTCKAVISNSTLLYDGELLIHSTLNVSDPKLLDLGFTESLAPLGVLFTAIDGTPFQAELASQTFGTYEELRYWVKVPDISKDVDTEFYMKWNQTPNLNYTNVTGTTTAQSVWDVNYTGVFNYAQAPENEVACILDSTSNVANGTPHGNIPSDNLIETNNYGQGLLFDVVNQFVALDGDVWNNTLCTVEYLIRYDSGYTSDQSLFVGKGGDGESVETNLVRLNLKTSAAYLFMETGLGSNHEYDDVALDYDPLDGEYHNLSATFENNTLKFGIDDFFALPQDIAVLDTTADIGIGPNFSNTYGVKTYSTMLGVIASLRFSDIARSEAWIKATNESLNNTLSVIDEGNFVVSGIITNGINPIARVVNVHDRETGEFLGTTTSDAETGEFCIERLPESLFYVVALDDDADDDFNIRVFDRIVPVEIV